MRILAITVLCFIGLQGLGSCVAPPSPQELAAADYGDKPDEATAKQFAKQWILERLKDPGSAQFGYGQIDKAWYRQGLEPNKFAWRLPVAVNAKNSYGGYTGDQLWCFYFRGNRVVALGEPYTSVGSSGVSEHTLIVETDFPLTRLDATGESQSQSATTDSPAQRNLRKAYDDVLTLQPGVSTRADANLLLGEANAETAIAENMLVQWTHNVVTDGKVEMLHVAILFDNGGIMRQLSSRSYNTSP